MKKFDRVIVIDGHPFSTERRDLQEMVHRNIAMSRAREDNPEWIIIFDADERIYEMPEDLEGIDAVEMKFFDAYITPVDVLMPYYQREYFGIEYRRIINMVRTSALKEIAFPARIHERVPDIKE